MFWGVPSQDGSLSNLRSIIRRLNVDEKVKVFNVGDEFLMHAFQAHLTTAIMEQLKLDNRSAQYDHPCSLAWLRSEAEKLVKELWHLQRVLTLFILCTRPFFMWHIHMLTYERLFAGRTALKSYGIGSGGYHDSWPLDAPIMLLKQLI